MDSEAAAAGAAAHSAMAKPCTLYPVLYTLNPNPYPKP